MFHRWWFMRIIASMLLFYSIWITVKIEFKHCQKPLSDIVQYSERALEPGLMCLEAKLCSFTQSNPPSVIESENFSNSSHPE